MFKKIILVVLAVLIGVSPTASAASDYEFRALNDVLYYDKSDDCNTATPPSNTPSRATPTPANTPSDASDENAKIAKTLIPMFNESEKDLALQVIEKYKFGGMAPLGERGSASQVYNKAFVDDARTKAGGSFVMMADQEGGSVMRYNISADKSAKDMGGMSVEEVKKQGETTGTELKNYGVDVNLAPVLDVAHGKGGVNHLGPGDVRAFSDNPATVTEKAGAYAEGLSSSGVKPTYKHFPGLGNADGNTDTGPVSISWSNTDIEPFKNLANKNSGLIMLTNARISDMGNEPAPMNKQVVERLRNEAGFNGTIISDEINSAFNNWNLGDTLPDRIKKIYEAGVDLILFDYPDDATMDQIISKVKSEVPKERIDEAYSKYQSTAAGTTQSQTQPTTQSNQQSDVCCPSGGDGSSDGTIRSVSSSGEGGDCGTKEGSKANQDQVWSYFNNKFKEEGYSTEEAEKATAGIMGNWQQESGFSPDRHNQPNPGSGCSGSTSPVAGGVVGYGIAQWCGSRQTALKDFATERGKSDVCLGVQLEYTWEEMNGKFKSNLTNGAGQSDGIVKGEFAMKGKSPAEAARHYDKYFEGSEGSGERDAKAEAIYREYTGKDPGTLSSSAGNGANCSDSNSTDTNVPPAECGQVVEEARKLVREGKLKSINGPENFEADLAACGQVNSSSSGCVGVHPEIVRAVIGLTKYIDSKGMGPVTFASFNKGHDCDGGKHTQGKAVDLWYGIESNDFECNGSRIYSKEKCKETMKWIQDNHGQYDIGAALHNPCAVEGLPNNQAGCNKDGVQYYLEEEGDMIHMSIGKDGRW